MITSNVPALAWAARAIEPVLSANNPLLVLMGQGSTTWQQEPFERLWPMMRNMTVWGGVTLGIAIWQLRPAYFRQLAARERPRKKQLSDMDRPPMGEDPMLWRERFAVETGMHGRIARWMMILAALVCAVVVLLALAWAIWTWILPDASAAGHARGLLHAALSSLSSGASVILLLAVAIRAAISVAMERDGGTLDALLISPLTGQEIVKGKLIGAFWGLRSAFGPLALAWAVGVITGLVAPVGPFVLALDLVVFTFLSAAIGMHYSILVVQPVTAVAYTAATWLMVCAGYMLVMIGPANLSQLLIFPLTPGFVYVLGQFDSTVPGITIQRPGMGSWLTASLIWDAFFLSLGIFFYRSAARNFDVLVGRSLHIVPRRR